MFIKNINFKVKNVDTNTENINILSQKGTLRVICRI